MPWNTIQDMFAGTQNWPRWPQLAFIFVVLYFICLFLLVFIGPNIFVRDDYVFLLVGKLIRYPPNRLRFP